MRRSDGLLCLTSLNIAVLSALLTATALADQVPVEFQGTWSQRCTDPAAPSIQL